MPPITNTPRHTHTAQPGEAQRVMRLKAACDASEALCAGYSGDVLRTTLRGVAPADADAVIDHSLKLQRAANFASYASPITGGLAVIGLVASATCCIMSIGVAGAGWWGLGLAAATIALYTASRSFGDQVESKRKEARGAVDTLGA